MTVVLKIKLKKCFIDLEALANISKHKINQTLFGIRSVKTYKNKIIEIMKKIIKIINKKTFLCKITKMKFANS